MLTERLFDIRSARRDSFTPEEALRIERESVEERLRELLPRCGGAQRAPLAVALSGGGQRAAALACGLLWSLAEREWLPHIRHISAVSGGSYAASALATHIRSAGGPEGPDVNGWYRERVEDCIMQFQDNISHLVRVPRGSRSQGVGSILHFTCRTIGTLIASTMLLALYVVVPMTIAMDAQFSSVLHTAFCYPHPCMQGTQDLKFDPLFGVFAPGAFEESCPLLRGLCLALAAAAAAIVLELACCRPPETDSSPPSYGFLFARALRELALKVFFLGLAYLLCFWMVFWAQFSWYGFASSPGRKGDRARDLCRSYAEKVDNPCLDRTLLRQEGFLYLGRLNSTSAAECAEGGAGPSLPGFFLDHPLVFLGCLVLCALAASAVALSRMLNSILGMVGPFLTLCFAASIAAWMIFGPLTEQYLISSWLRYTSSNDFLMCSIFVFIIFVTLPFYRNIQQSLHDFNTNRLQRSYFKEEASEYTLDKFSHVKDITADSILCYDASGNGLYCPNLVIGASVQDFRRRPDTDWYSDFELTPLFLGGDRTMYHRTKGTGCRLKTAMGVSAGAVDIAMSSRDAYKTTASWWLAKLSLQMGAWVRVRPTPACCGGDAGGRACCPALCGQRRRESPAAAELLLRLPFVLAGYAWYGVIYYLSWDRATTGCPTELLLYYFAAGLALFLLALHLSFLPVVEVVFGSPLVRHWMLILKHQHFAREVPEYLYLLDGGLVDSIGVVALLRRRERLILALDAASPASPPADRCRFLRECLERAVKERLCSFTDPKRQGRDWSYALEDFARSDERVLHLRVLYEPRDSAPAAGTAVQGLGADLFLVRMWLQETDGVPQGTPLEREELRRPRSEGSPLHAGASLRRELRGVCCFDGCHRKVPSGVQGRCGRFPHVPMANQFLTRTLFAELCRLGRELGNEALDRIEKMAADNALEASGGQPVNLGEPPPLLTAPAAEPEPSGCALS